MDTDTNNPDQHHWTIVYLDAKDTLSEEDVTAGLVDVVVYWVSRVDHQAVNELHGLSPLSPQLARHDNLATILSK